MHKLLKIVLGIFFLGLIVFAFQKLNYQSKYAGELKIEIINLAGDIKKKEVSYVEDEALADILKNNFSNVVIEDGFIYSIENLTTASDFSHFISLYVNGKLSSVGLNSIVFYDGMTISFVETIFEDEGFSLS